MNIPAGATVLVGDTLTCYDHKVFRIVAVAPDKNMIGVEFNTKRNDAQPQRINCMRLFTRFGEPVLKRPDFGVTKHTIPME